MLQCVAVCCSVVQAPDRETRIHLQFKIEEEVIDIWTRVCCRALQYIAMCCSVLQYHAVCCSDLIDTTPICCSRSKRSSSMYEQECVAVCCSVLQCVAVCCSDLIDTTSIRCSRSKRKSSMYEQECVAVCCSVLQRVAACCGAVCCSVLQCVAVCCRNLIETHVHLLFKIEEEVMDV